MTVRREQGSFILYTSRLNRDIRGKASDKVRRGRRIIGIFLAFLSAMRVSFSDVLIRRAALATACSSLASPPGSEKVVC